VLEGQCFWTTCYEYNTKLSFLVQFLGLDKPGAIWKKWISNIPKRIIAENFYHSLPNYKVLVISGTRGTLNLHCSNVLLFPNSLETCFFFGFFLGLMLHCQELHLKSFPFEESKIVSFLSLQGMVIIRVYEYSSVEELELFGKA
jgi:hypothetical protein